MKVAIIGAGTSGLSCAIELVDSRAFWHLAGGNANMAEGRNF